MKIKIIILGLGVFTAGIIVGFKFGEDARAREEMSVSIPALVTIHESIQTNDLREASGLTEMVLFSKIDKYNYLKHDVFCRIIYGNELIGSKLFQKHLKEALAIKSSAFTNLIFFNTSANGGSNGP